MNAGHRGLRAIQRDREGFRNGMASERNGMGKVTAFSEFERSDRRLCSGR